MEYLDNRFESRLMARNSLRGLIWPAHSPDLSPLDFFAWSPVKSKVYVQPILEDLEALKHQIIDECNNLDKDMIKRAVFSVKKWAQSIANSSGRYIEN